MAGLSDFLSSLFSDSGSSDSAPPAQEAPGLFSSYPAQTTMPTSIADMTYSTPLTGQSNIPYGGTPQQSSLWSLLPAAVSGAGGLYNLFRKNPTDQAIKSLQKSTQPMQAAGNQALGAYTSGQLTPTQQAAVDQKKQQDLAQYRNTLARMGIPVGSAEADLEAKANQDALVYSNQLLQQDFANAVQATGMSTNNLTNLALMQAQQDAAQRQAWAAFMQELAKLGGDIGPMLSNG